MKPAHYSPAHRIPEFAELVCSNSLRSNVIASAVGLLKEEMRRLGSLVLAVADETAVPAGRALAVDRIAFSQQITETIRSHPQIEVRHELVVRIPEGDHVVVATGPLTAPELAAELQGWWERRLSTSTMRSPRSSTPTPSITRCHFALLATRRARGTT